MSREQKVAIETAEQQPAGQNDASNYLGQDVGTFMIFMARWAATGFGVLQGPFNKESEPWAPMHEITPAGLALFEESMLAENDLADAREQNAPELDALQKRSRDVRKKLLELIVN